LPAAARREAEALAVGELALERLRLVAVASEDQGAVRAQARGLADRGRELVGERRPGGG